MLDTVQLTTAEGWLALAPDMHIGDAATLARVPAIVLSDEVMTDIAAHLKYDGYFQRRHEWGLDLARMAGVVRSLTAQNIPAVFGFLFDEFWLPFYALAPLYRAILGANYAMLPDFWIWNVDPTKGDAGWKPHRDRGPDGLFPDGLPKSLTTWIPLSAATPLTSCMYVVPAHLDPDYGHKPGPNWRFELPAIRALPALPGDFFVWNQAILHWGSRSSPFETQTRVSMAFEFQRTDVEPFNRPLLEPNKPFPFDLRLRLIAKQVLQYRHMYKVDPAIERLAQSLMS